MSGEARSTNVGDGAVREKTGRGWDDWFALLDAAGAAELDHKGIVALVAAQPGVSPWWQQSVTVAYEKARGLRALHQTTKGYEVSVNRTVGAPIESAFEAWHDAAKRRAWLAEPIVVRKSTHPKSLRITWSDGRTHVDVGLYAKGAGRTQVGVGHRKIEDAAEADRLKAFWGEALERLKAQLEGGAT